MPSPSISSEPRIPGISHGHVNQQLASAFLTKLPAELRNEVYSYVFSGSPSGTTYKEDTGSKEKPGPKGKRDAERNAASFTPHNPLALLLTCRKINTEATLLAFRSYTFILRTALIHHRFRERTSVLSLQHINAITRLALSSKVQHITRTLCERACASFIAHGVATFPRLREIEFCVREGKVGKTGHGVPGWFTCALSMVGESHYVWLEGEGWTWEMEDGSKSRAIIKQERSGRTVKVGIVYISEAECVFQAAPRVNYLRLVPGTARALPVESVDTVSGMEGLVYEPGEEYWEGLRRKTEAKRGQGAIVNLGEMMGKVWWGLICKLRRSEWGGA